MKLSDGWGVEVTKRWKRGGGANKREWEEWTNGKSGQSGVTVGMDFFSKEGEVIHTEFCWEIK